MPAKPASRKASVRPSGKAPPAKKGPAKKTPAKKTPAMTLAQVRAFLEALGRANPDPQSELAYTDPYTLLVAVVLSAQATDASVNKATVGLFADAPTPAAMVALGVEGVGRHVRSIGLWQTKARNVVELSRQLMERHGGVVPADREALEALPGVGRKTANVVLNVAFGEATMAVDTHVFRLGNRTGIAPGKTPLDVEDGPAAPHPARPAAAVASLADSAWAVLLQGAGAGMLALRRRRALPLS